MSRTVTILTLLTLSSENYIFGKFDTFCGRLEKISEMISTMQQYSGLSQVKIEGIEVIAVRYKNIVEVTRKKTYDVLDHRKPEVLLIVKAVFVLQTTNLFYTM